MNQDEKHENHLIYRIAVIFFLQAKMKLVASGSLSVDYTHKPFKTQSNLVSYYVESNKKKKSFR